MHECTKSEVANVPRRETLFSSRGHLPFVFFAPGLLSAAVRYPASYLFSWTLSPLEQFPCARNNTFVAARSIKKNKLSSAA